MQPQDASDVMQDVFQSLLPDLASFRRRNAQDSFRGWLWTVCRNKIRDHFRRQKNRAQAVGGTHAHQVLQRLLQRWRSHARSQKTDHDGSSLDDDRL